MFHATYLAENQLNIQVGFPPVIYDDCNEYHVCTRRLIILMKKSMGLLGDKPKALAMDGAQWFDVDEHEDFPFGDVKKELGLEIHLIPREMHKGPASFPERKNRFCVMVGEEGKVVIGAY